LSPRNHLFFLQIEDFSITKFLNIIGIFAIGEIELPKCPKCGFKIGKGKVVLRIWCTEEVKKKFYSYALEFPNLQGALFNLLEKAELYDKLSGVEKTRAYVESPTKKS